QTIERELKNEAPEPRPKRPEQCSDKQLLVLDITAISAPAFHINLKKRSNEFFTTSLYKIDRLIEEKYRERLSTEVSPIEPEESKEAILYRTVPPEWHDLIKAFLKQEGDKLPPYREYDYKIELEGDVPLGFRPLYQHNEEELIALKKWLVENLDKGYIEHSSAPFVSPILFIRKKSGALRLYIDFRKLNSITRKDRYPLPLLEETIRRLARAKIYTKLDIQSAFNKIRMDPSSEELTSFRTRYGQYKCKVLPFRLTNRPATYQRYINDVLFNYLDDFCTTYLDDIIIYSDNELEHTEHVRKVLQRLLKAGLYVNIQKSEFKVKKTKLLGFIIRNEGIEVDPEKVSVIKD